MTAAVVLPSWPALERALWLAACDRRLRSTASDGSAVRTAMRVLRGMIDRWAPTLYAQAWVDDAAERWWLGELSETLAGSPDARATVALWAAVACWTDAPNGRWGALADAAADLGDALDVGGTTVLRSATALRDAMAVVWREME